MPPEEPVPSPSHEAAFESLGSEEMTSQLQPPYSTTLELDHESGGPQGPSQGPAPSGVNQGNAESPSRNQEGGEARRAGRGGEAKDATEPEPNPSSPPEQSCDLKSPFPINSNDNNQNPRSPLSRWKHETSICEPWNAVGESRAEPYPHLLNKSVPIRKDSDSVLSAKGSSKNGD